MISIFLRFVRKKQTGYTSEFALFMRNASAREKKKVFLKAARLATEDQLKIMKKASIK